MKRPALYSASSFTLIETLVAIGLLSMVGFVLLNFVTNAYSIYSRGQISSSIRAESDLLTSRIANALRGTFDVQVASSTNLTVLSYFAPTDTTPTKVSFSLSGSSVTLTTIQGEAAGETYTYDPQDAKTRAISSHFVASPPTPLFQYYNETATLLSSPIDIKAVHVIEITSTLQSPLDNKRTAEASTAVQLRNLKTNL